MFWDLTSGELGVALPKDQVHAVSIYEMTSNGGPDFRPALIKSMGGAAALWPAIPVKWGPKSFERLDERLKIDAIVKITEKSALKAGRAIAAQNFPAKAREVHLIVADTEFSDAESLTDDELRLLPELALGQVYDIHLGADDYPIRHLGRDDALEAEDIDHAMFIFEGYKSRIGLFVRKDGSASLISACGYNFDFDKRSYAFHTVGHDQKRIVAPITVRVEWRGRIGGFTMSVVRQLLGPLQNVLYRNTEHMPSLHLAVGVARDQASAFVGFDLEVELGMVMQTRDEVESDRFKAPVSYAPGVSETRIQQLIAWNEMVEFSTYGLRGSIEFSGAPWEEGNFACANAMAAENQEVFFEAAALGFPAAVTNSRGLSREAKTILNEILRWSGIRGETVIDYAGNRAKDAIRGGAKRCFSYANGADETAHDILFAIDGLTDFLKSQGYSQAEIDKLLDRPALIDDYEDYGDPPPGWGEDMDGDLDDDMGEAA
jgi:hypothetical protein